MSSSRSLMFVALVCAIPAVYTYSDGAPEGACGDMTPQHGVEPQPSAAPYKLFLSSKQLDSSKNEQVNIKIQGNGAGDTIKGLMLQARMDGKPVGEFAVKSRKHAKLLNCLGGEKNAVTHKKIFGAGPKAIEATWTPPADAKGEIKFFATVALNGGVFWVGKLTETATIN